MLAWLDRQMPGSIDEITVVTQLEEFRRLTGEETQMPLRDVSFDTISGAGPNGAIMHYRVSRGTNRKLAGRRIVPARFRRAVSGRHHRHHPHRRRSASRPTRCASAITLVLKGMVGLSMLRFPAGHARLGHRRRRPAGHWKAGIDYAHGTGHGVGSYLSVHEGPQRIAKTGTERLLAGMILSNEPGYYKEGAYGIRIENLILVTPAEHGRGRRHRRCTASRR